MNLYKYFIFSVGIVSAFFAPSIKTSSGQKLSVVGQGPPFLFSTGLFGTMPSAFYSEFISYLKKNITIVSIDGLNKKYCNSYYLPYEFAVTKEFGLNHKVNYNIEPKAIFEDYSNQKTILANIYYTFTCSHEDNEPKLLLNIVPTNDESLLEEIVSLSYMISFALCICLFIKCLLR